MDANTPGQGVKVLVKTRTVGHEGGIEGRPLVAKIESQSGVEGIPRESRVEVKGIGIKLRKNRILAEGRRAEGRGQQNPKQPFVPTVIASEKATRNKKPVILREELKRCPVHHWKWQSVNFTQI
jgi:hypothetical protein